MRALRRGVHRHTRIAGRELRHCPLQRIHFLA
jgi:hypothetical protein